MTIFHFADPTFAEPYGQVPSAGLRLVLARYVSLNDAAAVRQTPSRKRKEQRQPKRTPHIRRECSPPMKCTPFCSWSLVACMPTEGLTVINAVPHKFK